MTRLELDENQLGKAHYIFPFFTSYTVEELNRGLRNLRMQEWEPTGIGYRYFYVRDIGDDTYQTGISYITHIDRQTNYFVAKVVIPIITILIVCWFVFFIKIEDLESRLTVSIVCLLSLIAYTFIVDQEVPKLSYLTILDYVILISYFFASISTLGAIIISAISKTNLSRGQRVNRYLQIYLPIIYLGVFFSLSAAIILQSSNTITALR